MDRLCCGALWLAEECHMFPACLAGARLARLPQIELLHALHKLDSAQLRHAQTKGPGQIIWFRRIRR
jgi:hypothetical protein